MTTVGWIHLRGLPVCGKKNFATLQRFIILFPVCRSWAASARLENLSQKKGKVARKRSSKESD